MTTNKRLSNLAFRKLWYRKSVYISDWNIHPLFESKQLRLDQYMVSKQHVGGCNIRTAAAPARSSVNNSFIWDMLVTRSSANRDVSIDAAFGEIFERTVWLCRQGVKGECVGRFQRNGLLPAV